MTAITSLLTAFLLTPAALATTVHIDFGRDDTGQNTSGNFNNITGSGGTYSTSLIASLVDETGTGTGITLESQGGSFAGSGADYSGTYPAAISSQPVTALEDSLFIRQNTNGTNFVTITLSNLSASSTYDLLLYSARGGTTGGTTTYSITDDGGATPYSTPEVLNNSGTVVSALGLTPDGSGEIVISMTTIETSGVAGALNYMSITATPIPEPSSALLLTLSGMGLLFRRRN